MTVGIGAALLAGAGSAAAETEDSSASSATTSTADRAETEKPSVKTTTSPKPDTDREAVSVRTPDPRNSLDKPGNETEDNADEAGGDASSGAVSRRGSSAASTPNAPRSRKAASEDTIDSEVSLNDDGHEEATIPPATDSETDLQPALATDFVNEKGAPAEPGTRKLDRREPVSAETPVEVESARAGQAATAVPSTLVLSTAADSSLATFPIGPFVDAAKNFVASRTGRFLYVPVLRERLSGSAVAIFDTETNTVDEVSVSGGYITGVTLSPTEERLYVSISGGSSASSQISVIDTRTRQISKNVPIPNIDVDTGEQFQVDGAVVVSSDGKHIYQRLDEVGCGDSCNSRIAVVDADTWQVIQIAAGPGPSRRPDFTQDMYLSPDGKHLYVSDTDLFVIDTATHEVSTIAIDNYYPSAGIFSADGKRLYLTGVVPNFVTVIDTEKNTVMSKIDLGGWSAADPVASPDRNFMYVHDDSGTITVIDTRTSSVSDAFSVGILGVEHLLISRDGKELYLLDYSNADVAVISISTGSVRQVPIPGYAYDGRILLSPNGEKLFVLLEDATETYGSGTGQPNNDLLVIVDVVKDGGNENPGGEDPGGTTNPIEEILNGISFSNEVTKWLDNLSKIWNLGDVLKGYEFVAGIHQFADGIRDLDLLKAVSAIPAIISPLFKGPLAILLEAGKLAISIVLPLNDTDSEEFFEFRARCMFGKDSDSLNSAEAQRLVDRYTGAASILTIPADYARYNVGGWFGRPLC